MTQATIDIPNGVITNGMIVGPLSGSKLTPAHVSRELFGPAVSVTALTTDFHIVSGATGTLVRFQAAICGTIATGADRTVTVDLHKSTGGSAFSTVLSSTIGFTNVSVLRTVVGAVLSSTSVVAGDVLRVIVTVAGAAGNQALGLNCTLTLAETYA